VGVRRRTWLAVPILSILILVVLTAPGVVHHLQRPRFVASVSPIQVSLHECLNVVSGRGWNSGYVSTACRDAATGTWFRAEVMNVGHRLAFLTDCMVIGLDPAGHRGFVGTLGTGHPAPNGGLAVDAGKSVTWEWYVVGTPFKPPPQVSHYQVACTPIEYGDKIPT
jgi:hypothetical protein